MSKTAINGAFLGGMLNRKKKETVVQGALQVTFYVVMAQGH